MTANPLVEALNRVLHAPGRDTSAIRVEIVHRGLPGDIDVLTVADIDQVTTRALVLLDEREIPWHRVLVIRDGDDIIIDRRPPV